MERKRARRVIHIAEVREELRRTGGARVEIVVPGDLLPTLEAYKERHGLRGRPTAILHLIRTQQDIELNSSTNQENRQNEQNRK